MSNFVCNMEALNQDQRQRYFTLAKQLFAKAERNELPNGYLFTFPRTIPIDGLEQWILLESKCCPFLECHIDVRANQLISLTVTGETGIKEFILSELRQLRAL